MGRSAVDRCADAALVRTRPRHALQPDRSDGPGTPFRADRCGCHGSDDDTLQSPHPRRAPVCGGPVPARAHRRDLDLHLSARDPLRRAHGLAGRHRADAADRTRVAARCGPRRRDRPQRGRATRAGSRHELRRAPQRGDPPLSVLLLRHHGHDRRPHHRRHRAVLLARLGAGAARAAARRGDIAPHGKRRARAASDRARPARTHPRPRASVSSAATAASGSGLQDLLRATLHGELRGHDIIVGQQSRAFHPRPHAAGNTRAEPGQRPGDRAGAGDAGLLGHLDRSRQRFRGPRDRRRQRPRRRPARSSRLPAASRLAQPPRRRPATTSGFANEGLWPLCHNAHVRPTFRSHDFEHYRRGQRAVRRRGRRRGHAPTTRSSWCRTTTSPSCRG